jgi:hypothetical protein
MVPDPDVRAFNQALVDLQHQLDLLLGDIADLQSTARTLSPNLLKVCRHLEILISEADAVLRVPDILGLSRQSGSLH